MIIGVGCDIVTHEITEKLGWTSNPQLLKRIFSEVELKLYSNDQTAKSISGRFAVKEAVVKCLGTGMIDGLGLDDIHILQNEYGRPYIKVSGGVEKLCNELGINSWHVSISHTHKQSMAFVIAERTKA